MSSRDDLKDLQKMYEQASGSLKIFMEKVTEIQQNLGTREQDLNRLHDANEEKENAIGSMLEKARKCELAIDDFCRDYSLDYFRKFISDAEKDLVKVRDLEQSEQKTISSITMLEKRIASLEKKIEIFGEQAKAETAVPEAETETAQEDDTHDSPIVSSSGATHAEDSDNIVKPDRTDPVSEEACPPRLLTIKKEFSETFEFIKKNKIKSVENMDTTLCEKAIDAKRMGQYEQANHLYCTAVHEQNGLTTTVAAYWFKTLAVSGDIRDAIALAQYVIQNGPHDRHTLSLESYMYRIASAVEGVSERSLMDELKVMSGLPMVYNITIDDLDVPCKKGVFNDVLKKK